MVYKVWDESGAIVDIEADSAEQAAQKYVDTGDWFQIDTTVWHQIRTEDEDGEIETFKIARDPDEPTCSADDHDWQTPIEIVGGIKENPGVWGHGGGVIYHECCMNCGTKKITDTWAQDPTDGVQGLVSLRYEVGAYDLPTEEEEVEA